MPAEFPLAIHLLKISIVSDGPAFAMPVVANPSFSAWSIISCSRRMINEVQCLFETRCQVLSSNVMILFAIWSGVRFVVSIWHGMVL